MANVYDHCVGLPFLIISHDSNLPLQKFNMRIDKECTAMMNEFQKHMQSISNLGILSTVMKHMTALSYALPLTQHSLMM
jgi:hypothetical protein